MLQEGRGQARQAWLAQQHLRRRFAGEGRHSLAQPWKGLGSPKPRVCECRATHIMQPVSKTHLQNTNLADGIHSQVGRHPQLHRARLTLRQLASQIGPPGLHTP